MSYPVNLRALPSEVLEEVFTPENVRVRPASGSLSTLTFPKSRRALWDGAATGGKVLLHLCAHRALGVRLSEKALRLAQRHLRHSSRTLLRCFFIGNAAVDSDEEGVTVTLDRFDPGRDQNGARVPCAVLPGDVCVSCIFTSDPSALVQSEAELHQAFKTLQQSVSGRQSLDLSQILRLRLHVVWTQALDSADFSLSWSCVSPATSVHVEPVRAVHVIPTALVRSLTSPARPRTGSRQRGFLTMDQSRKLLLLLESDPKALSLPLVGVWFSGAAQVHSPQIWAWTLRFLHSASIQDRAFSESGCFLLVLFGSTHRTPQFFQCQMNGAGPELQYELLTGRHRTTLYQVASVEGQTLKCELTSEADSREAELFRQAHRAFQSSPAVGLSVTDQDSGVEDEDLSPRPSPSPHLPPPQTRRIQPSVPELSLLIDASFSSNHDAPRPQAPPPPTDSKCAPPLQFSSTPHSNLLQQSPNCACCNANNYVCTTIHATPGAEQQQHIHQNTPQIHQNTPQINQSTPQIHQSMQQIYQNMPQIHQSTPQIHQSTPQIHQNMQKVPQNPLQNQQRASPVQNAHPTPPSKHSSPSGHRQSPSSQRKSFTSQAENYVAQHHPTGISRSRSLPQMTPAPTSTSPQQRAVSSPNRHTNVTPTSQDFYPSPSNPAYNHANFTPEHATNVFQGQFNPPLNILQTPQSVSRLHHATASMNSSLLPPSNVDTPAPPAPCTNWNLAETNRGNSPKAVPSFAATSPNVMPLSCAHGVAAFPPPVACASRCCEQQGALSSGEAYQLLLQQDRQLRLLQQQVQMLLEAQAKLQSNHQQTENQTQTKSTASVAVGTGASLFWPEPPPLRQDSSSSPLPCSVASPLHSGSPHSEASPDSKLLSHDQPELRAERSTPSMEAPCSPAPSQSGLSGVESPVLGESASMYQQENHQETFYHSLMTQLNSRLREDEETQEDDEESKPEVTRSKQEGEEPRRQSLDRPPSPARSSVSSHSSSSASAPRVQTPSPGPVLAPQKKKKPKDGSEREDVVMSATLRRLQQLGVKLDKRDLSESDRVKARAVESASTLACINPAAVVSRLSASDPSLSLLPHSSADLSLEANAIALRYLSDRQLTRLSLSGPSPPPPAASDITVLSPNNMSLATRRYMRRYGLIEEEDEEDEEEVPKLLPQSQLIRELKPKMKLLTGQRREDDEEDKENVARTGTILGNQGSVGNILDLSRLRQLPKLF